MQDKLKILKNLQDIDQELNDVRRQLGTLESEADDLTAERVRVEGMVATLGEELAGLEAQLSELDCSLSIEQDNVVKAEGRLPAIKTQKEYVAVLKEIDTAKKVNKEIQDKIKHKNEEIAALAAEKAEKDAELAEVSGRTAERAALIQAKIDEIKANTSARETERNNLFAQIPPQLAKRYQVLIERRHGVAVVLAQKGACTGCNMLLPPQLYNNLYTTREILTCPLCSRLLYLGEI
ncbi:MAG: C4-type zinc ribbon domain-containing protein [Desulfuromonadales bacterium]|nr:C4-type zinc ribbon domain-containing protein [Desulfuromonadales bacterium]